jgi:superfamily II DNA/RNA helicase
MTFEKFHLPPSIAKILRQMSFVEATPIQGLAIPPALKGRDLLGLAQTGTGKTAAFALPVLVRLMNEPKEGALILAPTRELAMQIHAFVKQLAGENIALKSALIIGGNSLKQQTIELRRHPRILIATPGRLVDHLRSQPKILQRASILVLDEADRMLDMGFLPQLKQILRFLPRPRQTMMFSATFPANVRSLAAQFLKNPVEVKAGETSKPVQKIEQKIIETTHGEKNDILLDELNAREGSVLIFTRTKERTDRLLKFLLSYGYEAIAIHGDRTQFQRRQAIEGFRQGKYRILVATDVAARGLDIQGIGHVINYDLPQLPEDYIHRIGRTGRNGRSGEALCLLTPDDRQLWKMINR